MRTGGTEKKPRKSLKRCCNLVDTIMHACASNIDVFNVFTRAYLFVAGVYKK